MIYIHLCITCSVILISSLNYNNRVNNFQAKQYNRNESAVITVKTDTAMKLMNEDVFWKLIEESRTASKNNYQKQIELLQAKLLSMDAQEIDFFYNRLLSLLDISYDWNLWGAAYVINGGCSEDCFDYFRQYLISYGKDKFYKTIKDPESCAPWIKSEEEEDWEGLYQCAYLAYKQKTGNDIPKSYIPDFVLKGIPFDEEKVFEQYPKLAKRFIDNN